MSEGTKRLAMVCASILVFTAMVELGSCHDATRRVECAQYTNTAEELRLCGGGSLISYTSKKSEDAR